MKPLLASVAASSRARALRVPQADHLYRWRPAVPAGRAGLTLASD